MKTLRFENGELRLDNRPTPKLENEATVKVISSGICNTDIEIVRGYAGFEGTIGHEFVGIVEDSPTDPNLVGKRVVGEINVGCGVCPWCVRHDARHCPSRTVLGILGRDGCHAEFLTLPARNLLVVPENVATDAAVFTEPLAAALGIMEQIEILPETRVAVIGDGKLGILCAWALAIASENVVLIGKHRSKLSVAKIDSIETMLGAEIGKLGNEFDVVIEASGSESGFANALDLVRPRGKIVLKSTFHGKPTWEAWRIVVDEISVVGSRCGRFSDALKILANEQIDVTSLISKHFSIADGIEAMNIAQKKGVMKVLLEYE